MQFLSVLFETRFCEEWLIGWLLSGHPLWLVGFQPGGGMILVNCDDMTSRETGAEQEAGCENSLPGTCQPAPWPG